MEKYYQIPFKLKKYPLRDSEIPIVLEDFLLKKFNIQEFVFSFVEQVDIYEQEQPDGRFLKHIKFRFPVYFGDRETQELCWDNESSVETIVKLDRK